jgi:hypothetical protein
MISCLTFSRPSCIWEISTCFLQAFLPFRDGCWCCCGASTIDAIFAGGVRRKDLWDELLPKKFNQVRMTKQKPSFNSVYDSFVKVFPSPRFTCQVFRWYHFGQLILYSWSSNGNTVKCRVLLESSEEVQVSARICSCPPSPPISTFAPDDFADSIIADLFSLASKVV